MLPLAMLIPAAISAAAGTAKLASDAHKTKYEKEQQAEKERLETLRSAGQLGLTDEQRQRRSRDLMAPLRAAEATAATDQARLLANAGGSVSAGDIARQQAASRAELGQAGMQVGSYLDKASEAKAAAQNNKIAAIGANLAESKAQRKNNMFNDISQMAGAAGQLAGAVPGAYKMATPFGGARFNPRATVDQLTRGAGVPDDLSRQVAEMLSQPGADAVVQAAILGDTTDPRAKILRSLMVEAQSEREGNVDWSGTQSLMNDYLGNSATGGM